jgi:hypothetical protein
VKVQMKELFRERNNMFISLVKAHRTLELVNQVVVTSNIADVPQVDVQVPPVDEQTNGARPSVPETPVVSDTAGTNPFGTASQSGDSLVENMQKLKSELDNAQRVAEENTALREELERVRKDLAVANRMGQEKEKLIVLLRGNPEHDKDMIKQLRDQLSIEAKKTTDWKMKCINMWKEVEEYFTDPEDGVKAINNMKTEIQECRTSLKQITEALTLARTDNGKISRAIAVKTLVDFENAVISMLNCKDQAAVLSDIKELVVLCKECQQEDVKKLIAYVRTHNRAIAHVMKGMTFTGKTLEQFTELFDQHMKYLNDSAEALGTKKYEEITGMVEKVIGERDNLKGIIAQYEADKAAPIGGGDVNEALAALKIEKLAVDGELVTVKSEVEALNKKCTATRDEVNMVQAKLTLSEDQVTSEKNRTDKVTAELDMCKTALADETAKYQDLLKKAPTGPPPPSGGRPGTARLKDRVTILLEGYKNWCPH